MAEPKRILMVDDEVALLRIVREALTSCLRCEVDTSPKPEYGFELALKKNYDLFIFDFSMPMIDGAMLFFLIGKVYNNVEPPRVVPPLLLVSGKAEEERAQERANAAISVFEVEAAKLSYKPRRPDMARKPSNPSWGFAHAHG